MATTPHTNADLVKGLFSSEVVFTAADDTEIAQFIQDAADVVAEYNLSFEGKTTEAKENFLVDYDGKFMDLEAGAEVRNLSERPYLRAVVAAAATPILLDYEVLLSADIFTAEGEIYWVEDLRSIELAERYYAAAQLAVRASSGSNAGMQQYVRETLGDLTVAHGNPWAQGTAGVDATENIFMSKFIRIVGPSMGDS